MINLRDPVTLFVLWFAACLIGGFIITSREAAIWLSLKHSGVLSEVQIVRQYRRFISRKLTYLITYEYIEFSTGRMYHHEQKISFLHFRQWKVDDTLHALILPHNPRIARLIEEHVEVNKLLFGIVVSLIFPIVFLGINSIWVLFIICLISFFGNLLWINLRRK